MYLVDATCFLCGLSNFSPNLDLDWDPDPVVDPAPVLVLKDAGCVFSR